MSVLKIKDQNNDWIQIPTIKGDKGDPFTYADFTPEQLESLKGKDGISPTVSVASDTSDDYRLSFTDETHTVTTPNLIPEAEKIFDVYPTDSASGSIASFSDGADNIPLKSCIVQIEPVQEGSGDPSPDNVRPITGWTGVEVQRTGKNLVNPDDYLIGKYLNRNGDIISDATWTVTDYITCKPNTTYTITGSSVSSNTPSAQHAFYDKEKNLIELRPAGKSNLTFTTPNSCAFMRLSIRNTSVDGIQVELGSTATDYEPYTGHTYPITFPTEAGIVYGGYVDVLNGELVVDRAIVDLGTLWWAKATSVGKVVFYTELYDAPRKSSFYGICSKYKRKQSAPYENNTFILYGSDTFSRIGIRDDMYSESDSTAFKSSLSGTQVVYELAEPIHYPLTLTEIKTLLGTNNVWADTGDTEVEYRADVTEYINKKITEAVSALT